VQRGEDQVTGLRHCQGELNGLRVPHLAEEHDVGVLPQRRAQGTVEGGAVESDFTLRHGRGLVIVHVLNRVLDGEDVERPRLVDLVDD